MGTWTPPEEFEEYRLVRELGRGAMGQVWLAEDSLLERLVAIKFVAAEEPIDPAWREQFFVEARAVARLSHPNVVAVYRVGEIRRRPYLVTEFVRGTGLDRVEKPVPPEQVLTWGVQLARGLAAAHRRNVLHRDLKPANVMITEEGDLKLLDFGLSQLLDGQSVVTDSNSSVGSPLYMAPEAWRGERSTVKVDVYSLGVVLYELLAGKAPFAGLGNLETLKQLVLDQGAPSLAVAAPNLDPRLVALVDRCLERDPAARMPSADALREALESLGAGAQTPKLPSGNPYRGLSAFQAEHRALFFGRGAEVRALIDRLMGEPLVLATGDSGVGKSSLVRAGVLPAVEEGALAGGRQWVTTTVEPGRRPLEALAAAVAPHAHADEEGFLRLLGEDPEAAARALRKQLGRDHGLVIFIDQMEELVTLAPADAAARAAEALARLGGGPVRVLGTARSDFLTRLAGLPALDVPRALHLVRPLSGDDLREAIAGPARITGVRFETDAVVDELARAGAADGALPLLSFALSALWEARDVQGNVIPAAALERLGGVDGALAQHADAVLGRLAPTEREAARRLLLRLVTEDGTRSRRRADELETGDPTVSRAALEALVRGRLVVARETDGTATFEIAHEALLRGWETLRGWLGGSIEARAARQRLERAAADWQRLDHAPTALYRGRQLAEAVALPADELGEGERRFLAASQRAARRARVIAVALAVGLPALVVAGIGLTRWKARRDVAAAVGVHVDAASGSLSAARTATAACERARHEAFDRFDHQDWPKGEAAWSDALAAARDADAGFARAGAQLESALSVDPSRRDVRTRLADATFERLRLAGTMHRRDLRAELVTRLAAYDDDGSRRRLLEAPGRLELTTDPPGARVVAHLYVERDGRRVPGDARELGASPVNVELPQGSWLLEVAAAGRPAVRLAILIAAGETKKAAVPLPTAAPAGFAYVPAGAFLFGSSAGEDVRRGFLSAPPEHEVTIPAYYIAQHEVTFGDWIAWLRTLPADERQRRLPSNQAANHSSLRLVEQNYGNFRLELKPSTRLYTAVEGEPIAYAGRQRRSVQDWLKMPVLAVSFHDAVAYAAWLDATARVPGARLCDEREWERAARGADDRILPGGDHAAADDFDHDKTYGRVAEAYGPDEVGSHPMSRSPYGVDDLAGNAFEWARSVATAGGAVIRGGSWYQGELTANSTNHEMGGDPSIRHALIGLRICATPP